MKRMQVVVMILLENYIPGVDNACRLPRELTSNNIQHISKDCIEIYGNLNINSSIEQTSLSTLFQNTTRIHGCVFIGDLGLTNYNFLRNLERIECSDTDGNVLEIQFGSGTYSFGFQSLKRISGPGGIIIELGDPDPNSDINIAWTCSEFELFVNHPQYKGQTFQRLAEDESSCHPTAPLFDVPPTCRCTGSLILPPGTIYEKQLDKLSQIRVIFGILQISRTLLHNVSFLSHLEHIANADDRCTITMTFNEYMTSIELPNLRSIMAVWPPFVRIRNCPLLTDTPVNGNSTCYKVYERGKSLFELPCEFEQPQILPIKAIVSGDNYLVSTFIYTVPIVLSLLLNLRVLTYWISGSIRRGFTILRILIILQTFGITLIQVDNLIFYQRIMIPTFSLFSTFSFNMKLQLIFLESFVKFQISFRDLVLYVPHAVYSTVIMGKIMGRSEKINRILWIISMFVFFGAASYMVSRFKDLKVEFVQSSYDFDYIIRYEIPMIQRLPYYIKVTTLSHTNLWISGQENANSFFESSQERLYFLSELHTDGWRYTWSRLYAELAMLTFALFYHSTYYCMPRRYKLSATRLTSLIVLLQYFLMRYPSIRTAIWNSKSFLWPAPHSTIRRIGIFAVFYGCSTDDHTALIWHRGVHLGMLVVALYALKIAKYCHRLRVLRKRPTLKTKLA